MLRVYAAFFRLGSLSSDFSADQETRAALTASSKVVLLKAWQGRKEREAAPLQEPYVETGVVFRSLYSSFEDSKSTRVASATQS